MCFVTSDERQLIEGFICHCSRAGFRSPDQPTACELVSDAEYDVSQFGNRRIWHSKKFESFSVRIGSSVMSPSRPCMSKTWDSKAGKPMSLKEVGARA